MLPQTSLVDHATAYDVAECAIDDLIEANPERWPTRADAARALIVQLVTVVAELAADDHSREADLAIAFAERLHAEILRLYSHDL